MLFLNFYYFIDLIICCFCLKYIIDYDNNFKFFILGSFNFICNDCIYLCNLLIFKNYYLEFKKNIYFVSFLKDFYDFYINCYPFCVSCISYYYNLKKEFNYFCEFFKQYFNIYFIDYYDFYIYCKKINCFNCYNHFNKLNNNGHTFFIKNSNNLFYKNLFYDYFSYYENVNYTTDFFENINLEEIYCFLNNFIIGQDLAKKSISISIYNHYKKSRLNVEDFFVFTKNNILIIGPSGSGKTFLVKTLSTIINLPVIIVDATTFTEVGYVGEDTENMIQKLFEESDFDLEKTEIGIIFIDEIDKISSKNSINGRDISGEGVQQSLLKIIESTYCTVSFISDDIESDITDDIYDDEEGNEDYFYDDYENQNNDYFFLTLSTENILFICGGAFSGIEDNIEKISEKKFNIFDTNLLINFGLIPELIGRFPIIINFNNIDNLFFKKFIFSNNKKSITSYYNNLFIMENVEIFIYFDSFDLISKMVLSKNLGNRGLKSVLDSILFDVMYKLPNLNDLILIILHKYIFFNNNNGPLLVYNI